MYWSQNVSTAALIFRARNSWEESLKRNCQVLNITNKSSANSPSYEGVGSSWLAEALTLPHVKVSVPHGWQGQLLDGTRLQALMTWDWNLAWALTIWVTLEKSCHLQDPQSPGLQTGAIYANFLRYYKDQKKKWMEGLWLHWTHIYELPSSFLNCCCAMF